jgi:subtilisin family serine protease
MKHGSVLIAVLALVAGGCSKKSGDEKSDPAAGTASAAPAATDAAAALDSGDPAPAIDAAAASPTATAPLSDEQCKDVVLAIVACRSSGDDGANVAFDDWLLERFYGGTGIALLDPLQDEMDAWKKKPAKACADWRTWRAPEPFPDGAGIHAAAKSADCAKLRAAIDAAGGIPVAPDAPAE